MNDKRAEWHCLVCGDPLGLDGRCDMDADGYGWCETEQTRVLAVTRDEILVVDDDQEDPERN